MWRLWLLILVCGLLGGGCAGYRLGPTNGEVAGAKSIQINLFQNETFEPRLVEYIGTALRRDVQQDGTYHLNTSGDADIVVNGVVTRYKRVGLSFNPQDTITPTDFEIDIAARVTAMDRSTGKMLVDREVTGRTTIRIGPDLTSAERQAVPLLAEDLSRNITSVLVDGTW
jgi:hypothetical protein